MICSRCRTKIGPRKRKCGACGKKVVRRKPAHLKALELPYEHYVGLNGGEHCGICSRTPTGTRRLHRDHDHRTGTPRGLLCFRDNVALRAYMDADWLRRALAYVEKEAA